MEESYNSNVSVLKIPKINKKAELHSNSWSKWNFRVKSMREVTTTKAVCSKNYHLLKELSSEFPSQGCTGESGAQTKEGVPIPRGMWEWQGRMHPGTHTWWVKRWSSHGQIFSEIFRRPEPEQVTGSCSNEMHHSVTTLKGPKTFGLILALLNSVQHWLVQQTGSQVPLVSMEKHLRIFPLWRNWIKHIWKNTYKTQHL